MKRFLVHSMAILFFAFKGIAQTSEIQIINNMPDTAITAIDVYIDSVKIVDDLPFRNASPFITIPGNTWVTIGLAPGNSTSISDTIDSNPNAYFANNKRYVAFASGMTKQWLYAPHPEGTFTGPRLRIIGNVHDSAATTGDVDVLYYNGISDAPSLDLLYRDLPLEVDSLAFKFFGEYDTISASSHILAVTNHFNNSQILKTHLFDLTSYGGEAITVFTSGFTNPAANNNGASYGLFAALDDGTVIQFGDTSLGRVQFIHNCADPSAALVDVYADNMLVLDDFAFRTATSFGDVSAGGIVHNIGIAPSTSASVNDTIKNFEISFTVNETYCILLSGVINPANFDPNPDAVNTGLTLIIQNGIRENSVDTSQTEFVAVHGSTDAVTIDLKERMGVTLVDDATYMEVSPYVTIPSAVHILDITPAVSDVPLFTYYADMNAWKAKAAVVFASGFVNPATNQNGPAFSLCAAFADGTVECFTDTGIARLQVIHACADPAAATVDVYVDGNLSLNDFAFRTATPYMNIAASEPVNIGIAPGNSSSVNDTMKNFNVTLGNKETYLAVAVGVTDTTQFAPNPEGLDISFNLLWQNAMIESAVSPVNFETRAVSAVTDIGKTDATEAFSGVVADDVSYGNVTAYFSNTPGQYLVNITPYNNNSIILYSFDLDISSYGGQSGVLFSSGFDDPSQNQNGASFGLCAALSSGTVICFSDVTGVNEVNEVGNVNLYPNPAMEYIVITHESMKNANYFLEVLDFSGRRIHQSEIQLGAAAAKPETRIDVSGFVNGIYHLQLTSGNETLNLKFAIQKK